MRGKTTVVRKAFHTLDIEEEMSNVLVGELPDDGQLRYISTHYYGLSRFAHFTLTAYFQRKSGRLSTGRAPQNARYQIKCMFLSIYTCVGFLSASLGTIEALEIKNVN
jgi:hypothetical protein